MGRIKKKPRRSVGVFENGTTSNSAENSAKFDDGNIQNTPFFVDVDRRSWDSMEHRDISEIVLSNLNLSSEFVGSELNDEYCLRIRLCNVNQHVGRIKLGRWPILSSENIHLEFVKTRAGGEIGDFDVIVSGQFDGSDDGVSGLAHLVSLKFLTLRPIFGVKLSEDVSSLRIRVEMLQSVFDACESLIDNTRQAWKKSMMSVMGWLRPELTTSEARYGVCLLSEMEKDSDSEVDNCSFEGSKFDVGRFYEAIKRSK